MDARVWVEAARPRTLPAAFAPVIVGAAAADRFVAWRFAAAALVALSLQVAVNYANDYFDAVGGVDTGARVGPRRAVAAGLVRPEQMRTAMLLAFAVAACTGVLLAAAVGWELLVVGAAAIAAALAYSGGPRPYASAGLGEVFVFVFFGLVATVGTAYVLAERVVAAAVAAAVPVGLLAVAILVANNLRDLRTDRLAGKATLAVRLGDARTRRLYAGLFIAAFGALPLVTVVAGSLLPLLGAAALPAAVAPVRAVAGGVDGTDLIPVLAATALVQLLFAALLAAGLALAP
jgi:1,4-dihydroxy-2-naphthoate polyprenyltransferase